MLKRLVDGLRHLIDILIEGFVTLNHRLWVLVIPIGLDLFLWAGPRISPQRLAEALIAAVGGMAQVDPTMASQLTTRLQDWGSHANLAHLLAAPLTPALLPRLSTAALPSVPLVWTPSIGWMVLVALLALPTSLLLWSLYMAPLTDLVRGSGESGVVMLQRIPRIWGSMLMLLGMGLVAAFCFLTVALLLLMITAMLLPALGLLVFYLCATAALWILLYFYFTPEAILFSAVKPLQALVYSLQIVRSNLAAGLGFVLLTYMIRIGTAALWQRLAGQPLGVLAGILANAYVVSGLATAGLVFYRERLRRWLAADGQKERTLL